MTFKIIHSSLSFDKISTFKTLLLFEMSLKTEPSTYSGIHAPYPCFFGLAGVILKIELKFCTFS